MIYITIVLAYLIGSIPFGLVFGKCMGIDVRNSGSGNIGATNVNRLLGKKMGLFTLIADCLKGVLPMLVVGMFFADDPEVSSWVALAGGAAFLGHLFPVYLGFKGGKGVATALGVFLFLNPIAILPVVVVFVAVVFLSGYVSLGSLIAAALLPVFVWRMDGGSIQVGLAVFIGALIWLKHSANIVRLIKKQENSIRSKRRET